MTLITKKASKINANRRFMTSYAKARYAWKDVLKAYSNKHPNAKVILPAYIGWSANEGSGIFDPVSELNMSFEFYGLNKSLRIDVEDFKSVIGKNKNTIVLLVHYFGFPDDNYAILIDWLNENEVYYIEDSAHAMLTDLVGGKCGRNGAYDIYSLHKILPYDEGGVLVDNKSRSLAIDHEDYLKISDVFSYDLRAIFDLRRRNYLFLLDQLSGLKGITFLYPELDLGVCPQTCPIILHDVDRDTVYFEMNDQGFGLVSLYHTMIDPLKISSYESAVYTSKHIINLPVHQDCNVDELSKMVDALKNFWIK